MSEWRTIDGFLNYEVSDCGEVRNKNGKQLKAFYCGGKYKRVALFQEGKAHNFFVHRLVAKAFIGPIPDQVDHIDGDHLNNRAATLRLCSCRENMIFRSKKEFLGSRRNRGGSFSSIIRINCRHKSLGVYNTAKEASDRYFAYKYKLDSFSENCRDINVRKQIWR